MATDTTTTTTLLAPSTTAPTNSRSGRGSGGSGGTNSTIGGNTPLPAQQRISNTLAVALRQSGRGGGGGNPPAGGGRGNRPPGSRGRGGGPAPQNAPQIPIIPAADIRAMGTSPCIFEGDRKQARDFIEELQSYIRVNLGVTGFESPIRKVALALTFIKGPEVARWTAAIGRWIDGLDQVNNNVLAIWDQFLQELEDQFIDSTVGQHLHIELERLKMCFPEVDQYISKFKDLASLAGYTVGNEETINFFLRGLPNNIMTDILKPPFANTYDSIKERAIAVTKSKQLISAIKGRHNNAFQNTFGQRQPYQPFFQCNNYQGQCLQQCTQFNSSNTLPHMNNQVVPMDTSARTCAPVNCRFCNQFRSNAVQTGQDNQHPRLPKGPCFKCGHMGHFACECHSSTQINMMDYQDNNQDNLQDPMEPEINCIARICMEIGTLSKDGEERLIEVLGSTEGFQQA
jgi:Retrotransposon gag protein